MTDAIDRASGNERVRNLVGGSWVDPAGVERIDVTNPSTGAVIGNVPRSSAADVAGAVEAARRAVEQWRLVPLKERTQLLFRFRELVLADIDGLASSVSRESGKTDGEARAGILKGIEVVEYALSLQNLDDGGALEVSRGVTCELRREPIGVVAGITPFNFPAMVPMWMFPLAVTLGNAFVLKPSEKVPFTACRLGGLMMDAGFPPGVFSVVNGGREAVEALVDHPDVGCIGFVGSSAVARSVYTRATALGKRALALGGAKNRIIVVPDADHDLAVDGVVSSFTGCAGQRCMAASLMVAVGDVDEIIDHVIECAGKIRTGVDMGAIIDRAALERIEAAIERAARDGVEVRLDGRGADVPGELAGGNWIGPTVFDRAEPDLDCATRELFGPVLTIVRVSNVGEAIELEKRSGYGNATSVFTRSGAVARHVAQRSSSGMVGVNVGVPVPREPFSFGGTKSSRCGGGDITGRGGVELWTYLKKITSKWETQPDAGWMS